MFGISPIPGLRRNEKEPSPSGEAVGLGFGVEATMRVERYFEAGAGAKAV